MAAPTLTDLRKHLNVPDSESANDGEMQNVLDAAVELVGQMVGPLTPETVTEVHYGLWSSTLLLRRSPVVSVTEIVTTYGFPTTIGADEYVLEGAQGLVRFLAGRVFAGDYSVTYVAGWDVLPAPIHLGAMIVAGHLWDTQRVPGATPRFGQAAAPAQPTPMGFAIPNRAATLLEPYRVPVIA